MRQLTNRAEVMKGVIQRSRDADEELFAFRLVAELEKLDTDAYREQEIANARQDRQNRLYIFRDKIAQQFWWVITAGITTVVVLAGGWAYLDYADFKGRAEEAANRRADAACTSRLLQLKASVEEQVETAKAETAKCVNDKKTVTDSVEKIIAVCGSLK